MSLSDAYFAQFGVAPNQPEELCHTMYGLLARTAARYPTHIAWTYRQRSCRYEDLVKHVDRTAAWLYGLGIRRGERVGLCLPNCPRLLESLYGINRLGAVADLVSPLLSQSQIARRLSGCKAVLTLDRWQHHLRAALPEMPLLVEGQETAIEMPDPDLPEIARDADAPAVILSSGGTTGTPKGVVLSSRNCNALALQTLAALELPPLAGKGVLVALPNYHGFGLGVAIHTPLVCGARCVLLPQYSPEALVQCIRQEKPAIFPGVPAMFAALVDAPALKGQDLSCLEGLFCGGDALQPQLKARVDACLAAHGCREQLREGYGATECVAAACLMPRFAQKIGAMGRLCPGVDCCIVTPDTTDPLPSGHIGEICLRSGAVMLGYWQQPAETAQVLRDHGDGKRWLHTGDLGWLDKQGFLYFQQRRKRMIITNGYNVYPSELEQVLQSHPAVAECCVVGLPDVIRGQQVCAYVVPAAEILPGEGLKQALLEYCSRFAATYALPRSVRFCARLPRTPLGKVSYGDLEGRA